MTTRIEISDELRAEIANAVESIGVTCPEQVCDKLIELASADEDWRAELAAAKQRERLTADGLLDSREIADALAAEIEQDTDGAVECSVVEVETEQRYENRDERLGDRCVFTLSEMRACYRANGWDNGMSDDELDEDILSHDVVEVDE